MTDSAEKIRAWRKLSNYEVYDSFCSKALVKALREATAECERLLGSKAHEETTAHLGGCI
jgi:hypothetical protein